jgi:hypothetical protein
MEPSNTLVFSKGEWVTVPLPPDHLTWSFSDKLYYGSIWAFAIREKHLNEQQASQIAEAVVFQRLYPGITMSPDMQRLLTYLYQSDESLEVSGH